MIPNSDTFAETLRRIESNADPQGWDQPPMFGYVLDVGGRTDTYHWTDSPAPLEELHPSPAEALARMALIVLHSFSIFPWSERMQASFAGLYFVSAVAPEDSIEGVAIMDNPKARESRLVAGLDCGGLTYTVMRYRESGSITEHRMPLTVEMMRQTRIPRALANILGMVYHTYDNVVDEKVVQLLGGLRR